MELGTAIGLLTVIMATFAFEGLVYGDTMAEESFSVLGTPDEPDCGVGFIDGIACALDFVIGVFQVVAGALIFLFNLLSFNIPDAPWWIRVPLAVILDGGLVLLIVSIFRGN